MTGSTDPEMNAALEADAAKLEAISQDPGLTLIDIAPGPCPMPHLACAFCGAGVGEFCQRCRRRA